MTLQGTSVGLMDRRITLQTKTQTQNASGEAIDTWSDLSSVWAQIANQTVTEDHQDDQEHATAQAEFRIRWRTGVTAGSRVLFDGQIYDVIGVTEVGRQEVLSIDAIARSLP